MYMYLKVCYDQWCNGQDETTIAARHEDFIDMLHERMGYHKDVVREFLYRQPWFKKLS